MKTIIGFSGGAVGREGNVDRMVQAILDRSAQQTRFVKLAGLDYSGCKGCVQLCAGPQVCMLDDDLTPQYHKIKEADAVVIGAPVYFGAPNAMTVSFVERFFGYRHVSIPIEGKPFVLVVVGSLQLEAAANQLRRSLEDFFRVNVIDVVQFASECVPCLKCGRHRECEIGGLYMMLGEGARDLTITPDMLKQWEDNPETVAAVERAAQKLRAL